MVTEVCLGSMNWGQQNDQAQAFAQLDYALDAGINFLDTAEMYAVPPSQDTCGLTETYIGNWFAAQAGRREQVILASKIAGNGVPWIRDGGNITGKAITSAIDASLERLQTDMIDLYQLHWSNRPHVHFNRHWPGLIDPTKVDVEQQRADIVEILESLDKAIQAGKIRHIGLSNESPWGISEFLHLAEKHNLPRMVSIQNEFSLINLKDSPYLIESCVLNNVAYLPWSPLAGGALSGKYANGAKPANCRWTLNQRNGIFRDTTQSHQAIAAYQAVADKHGLSLVQLALAWVYQFTGVTSTIIGATSIAQLQEDIAAYEVALSDQILNEIAEVIRQYPQPF